MFDFRQDLDSELNRQSKETHVMASVAGRDGLGAVLVLGSFDPFVEGKGAVDGLSVLKRLTEFLPLRVLSGADRDGLPRELDGMTGEEMTSRSFPFDFPYFERFKTNSFMR